MCKSDLLNISFFSHGKSEIRISPFFPLYIWRDILVLVQYSGCEKTIDSIISSMKKSFPNYFLVETEKNIIDAVEVALMKYPAKKYISTHGLEIDDFLTLSSQLKKLMLSGLKSDRDVTEFFRILMMDFSLSKIEAKEILEEARNYEFEHLGE